jgi:hypothetical protein
VALSFGYFGQGETDGADTFNYVAGGHVVTLDRLAIDRTCLRPIRER